jgi:predicted alpha/beta-fold hydrolase
MLLDLLWTRSLNRIVVFTFMVASVMTTPTDALFSSRPSCKAASIAHSFVTREFKPAWFATNPHFQTVVSVFFRKESMYSKDFSLLDLASAGTGAASIDGSGINIRRPLGYFEWDRRQRITTYDGDFYDADWKYAKRGPTIDNDMAHAHSTSDRWPVVIICHGLESCSDSPLAKDMALAFNNIQMDAVCINFRGCSGECNLTPRAYHAGFTDDLMQQIRTIHEENPRRRIYLSGFSLGAGVVTKLLTDLGDKASEYNICGAAVNAV